jgi:hypothetical protein
MQIIIIFIIIALIVFSFVNYKENNIEAFDEIGFRPGPVYRPMYGPIRPKKEWNMCKKRYSYA